MAERIVIPARDEVSADTAALLDFVERPGRGPIPTVAVLAQTPTLFGPFLGWAAALAREGMLPSRDHELAALRAIHHCGSSFQRHEHSEFGRQAGITDDELAALERDDPLEGHEWPAHEAALLRAADELATTCTIADPTWAALASHYSPGQLVEIPYVVGQYTMMSMVASSLGIDADG
jgi:alkylhydroperoxidase family enzyme